MLSDGFCWEIRDVVGVGVGHKRKSDLEQTYLEEQH